MLREIVRTTGTRQLLIRVSVLVLFLQFAVVASDRAAQLPAHWKGTWTLSQDLGTPGIASLTDQQANRMLGQRITIAEHSVRVGTEKCIAPVFQVSNESISDFLNDYRVSASQFPLLGSTAETLEITCQRSNTYQLVRTENGCALFPQGGHFFQIVKAQSHLHSNSKSGLKCLGN